MIGNDPKRAATARRSAARLRCCHSGVHPGRRDVQRVRAGAAAHLDRRRSGVGVLRDADDGAGAGERVPEVRAEPRRAGGVEPHVPVDDDHVERAVDQRQHLLEQG